MQPDTYTVPKWTPLVPEPEPDQGEAEDFQINYMSDRCDL